jgi:hypothetical protein
MGRINNRLLTLVLPGNGVQEETEWRRWGFFFSMYLVE